MGELIALEVGPCAALDAFWTDGAVDAAQDPFRRRGDGRKRRLVFDARRGAVVASAAPAWDAAAPPAVAAAARAPFDGALVPLPLWSGAEALSGFGGFFAQHVHVDEFVAGGDEGLRGLAFAEAVHRQTGFAHAGGHVAKNDTGDTAITNQQV